MLRIRCVEEAIADRYTEWKMRCPTHLSIGQEAIAAAVGLLLNDDDFVVSTHRSHAHYLGKGGDLNKMIAEIYGKETGCSGGRGGSMHLIDENVGFKGSTAIVGNTIPIGVGLGLSIELNESNQISCVYLGDGAIEEGVFYESANFAAVRNLPVLFVCENNLYSVYSPLSVRQPKSRKIYEMVEAIGIKSSVVNGNNSFEIYKHVSNIVDEMRLSKKPHFIELPTYRWREHCGYNYDNDIGYRSEEEYESWKKKDPIKNMENKLYDDFSISKEQVAQIKSETDNEIKKAFKFAEDSAFPSKLKIFNHIYNY